MNSNANVLYLSYDGLCDPLGQSQILPYVLSLCSEGHAFTLISFEKPSSYKKYKKHIQNRIAQFPIRWIPLRYSKYPPILATLYDLMRLQWRVGREVRTQSFDIIHVRSYLPMLIAEKFRKSHKVIFDMRGFWADERKEGGIWPQTKWVFRKVYDYFINKERIFVTHSHALVSLTHNGVLALKERYPLVQIEEKVAVIPCCADEKRFNPFIVRDDLRRTLGLRKEDKVLIHIGSVGTWYRLDQEIAFFNALKEKDERWHFIILTTEVKKATDDVLSFAQEPQAIRVLSTSYDQVPSYLSIANASILLIEPCFSKRASFPVKLGESLMMGVPVIVNAQVGDNLAYLNGDNNGIVITEWEEIPQKAKAFDIHRFDAEEIRRFALDNLSLEKGQQLYASLYHDVLL